MRSKNRLEPVLWKQIHRSEFSSYFSFLLKGTIVFEYLITGTLTPHEMNANFKTNSREFKSGRGCFSSAVYVRTGENCGEFHPFPEEEGAELLPKKLA